VNVPLTTRFPFTHREAVWVPVFPLVFQNARPVIVPARLGTMVTPRTVRVLVVEVLALAVSAAFHNVAGRVDELVQLRTGAVTAFGCVLACVTAAVSR